MDSAELVSPVDEAIDGVVPDGNGRPGLTGSRVVIPELQFNMNLVLDLVRRRVQSRL